MRPFPSLLIVGALTLTAPSAIADPGDDPTEAPTSSPGAPAPAPAKKSGAEPRWRTMQTSDGVKGEIAAPLPPDAVGRRAPVRTSVWTVAPGVQGSVWQETSRRGPVRYFLLKIAYNTPGLQLDYANAGAVRRTAPLSSMISRSPGVVAGVNGDFFDIGDTGAPLGVGRDRRAGLLHGPRAGWNSGFYTGANGEPQVGPLPTRARILRKPGIKISGVNSPSVPSGGIGIYTPSWGKTSGYRVTDGQRKNVRRVMIRNGKVVFNGARLPSNSSIGGVMLVGRGAGVVKKMRKNLRVGTRAPVRFSLQAGPQMAITGNRYLMRGGRFEVVDDREMHPRTAIGIDRQSASIYLLVVDGRQSFSRGYTMVELAKKMRQLGVEDALNLDGGGSSTFIARRPNGSVGVINSPSDGAQRSIANGLELTYNAPARKGKRPGRR